MKQLGLRRLVRAASLCLTAATVGSLSPDPPSFFPDPIATIGRDPWGLFAYDLNADGKLDVISANGGSVSVLMGKGDGTFSAERRYAELSLIRPWGLDAGDFTGDGYADIVVGDYDAGTVSLLRGGPDGVFTPDAGALVVQPGCAAVLMRDFNGDGNNDLAVAGFYQISVHLGNGDGTLSAPIDFPTFPLSGYAMSAGDLDGDGVLDLAVSGGYVEGLILRGAGDGSFVQAGVLDESTDVDLGDVNQDGWLDLVTADRTGHLQVRLNAAGSGFPNVSILTHQDQLGWASSAVVDINGDGILDVAVGGPTHLSAFVGAGNGTFQGPTNVPSAWGDTMASGDFNRDGREDFVMVHPIVGSVNPNTEIALHFGQADGTIGLQSILVRTDLPAYAFAFGDLNEDGIDDIVAALRGGYPVNPGTLAVFLGNGHGGYTWVGGPEIISNPYDLALGDLNGDGHLDVVTASTGIWSCVPGPFGPVCDLLFFSDTRSYLGLGDGTFEWRSSFDPGNSGPLALADLDGDDVLDLAHTSEGGILVRHGAGDGTFEPPREHHTSNVTPHRIDAADVNADQIPDLVVGDSRMIWLLLGQPGGFAEARSLAAVNGAYGVTPTDLNDDGHPDIAALDQNRFLLLYGHGDGTFESVVFPSEHFQDGLGVGDFDEDGYVDLATLWAGLNIYSGGGSVPYSEAHRFRAYDSRGWIVTHDINRDGHLDIAASGNEGIRIHMNLLPPPNTPPQAVASAPAVAECGTFAGAAITLDGSASSDVDSTAGTTDDIVSYQWFEQTPSGEVPLGEGAITTVTLPLGSHTVGLRVTDAAGESGEALMGIEVVDTTPPTLTMSSPISILWPPTHRLVEVRPVLTATDLCGPATASITSASSSEPVDAPGHLDGFTSPDVVVPGDGSVKLRAERDARGPGRVYTVQVTAVDASGLAATGGLEVHVPHDQRPR
ncbi:MAG: FG-GAP repeat domain-containing protein [Candidatus Polarisedimenticolia bacterium]